VGQLCVGGESPRQRRIVIDRDTGAEEGLVLPSIAADELRGLPDDEQDDEHGQEAEYGPKPPPDRGAGHHAIRSARARVTR
jgi:hypothetical protein